MIGCIALGLAATALVAHKIHRRRHGYACGGYRGWHGHHHHHGGWGGGPWRMMAILGTSPAQEKVIREEANRMRDRARVAKEEAAAARGDLAEVLRADSFDKARFDAALGRVDAAWAQLKTAAADSAAKVHETLDSRQREKLAELLSSDRRGGPHFGPFR